MSAAAIRIDELGKRYRVSHNAEHGHYKTLRESLVGLAKAPFNKRAEVEDFWALKDISFEVHPGEVVGIIGRNGAGKSTLLKILSQITKPTEGRVEINGRVGSLLEVGTGFHPELTGRENVYLNGSILGMSRREIDKKFDEIIAFAEVEKFLDTPVKRYSSGMFVRLAFAVAAHLEPEILIVDEVLAVGDASFQKKCLGKMGDVARNGISVLLVSHQLDMVRRLSNKSALLNHGNLVGFGPTNEILSLYERDAPILLKTGVNYSIDTFPRSAGSGDVKFTRVVFTSDTGDDNSNLYSDGPMRIEVEIFARRQVTLNSLAVILFNMERVKLLNADILSLGTTITLCKGINSVSFSFKEIHLKPNRYVLGLWIAAWPKEVHDYIEYVGEVDVEQRSVLAGPPSDGIVTNDFVIEHRST